MDLAAAQIEHNLGLHLHLHNRPKEAEPFYLRAVAFDPEFTEAWINLGLAVLSQGRPDEALSCQRAALRLDPDSADAQNNLGMAHCAQGHIVEAENCFRSALRLRSDHPNATLNLGSTRQLFNHVEEAESLFRRALALGADPARANSNLALALMEQVRPEEAEHCCRAALALRPGFNEARANLALALLTMGRLEEGFREYEARWEIEATGSPTPILATASPTPILATASPAPILATASPTPIQATASPTPIQAMGPSAPILAPPRWTGQPLHGATVLLYAEQGFGDTLQFCRYAPMVAAAGGHVVLVVPKALRRLMTTLDGVAEVLCEEDALLPPFDYHCPLLSLPVAFGTTMATIPGPESYLRADPSPWKDFLAGLPGLKVGLVWAGRSRTAQPHAVAIDQRRSMRLTDMAPLLSVPGCSFVSLQFGPAASQMHALPQGALLYDTSRKMNSSGMNAYGVSDWADTAALVAGLDLVIAVDTAVAHLAGALGKPVWMLNRFDACWRWLLHRDDTPWYPSMRQFRQANRGDWAGVIARASQALSERAALATQRPRQ